MQLLRNMNLNIAPNRRVFIAGQTQSGKTNLVQNLISKLSNFFILDIKWQYSEFGAIVHSIADLELAARSGVTKFIYQSYSIDVEEFNQICKFILYNLKNITFIVEEVQNFCSKHSIPEYFKSLITMSQGDSQQFASKVGVWCISQRPANVHNDIITQGMVITFHLHEIDADALLVIPRDMILSLGRFWFAVWDDLKQSDNITIFPPL